ncbi:hypothetical protein TRP8649_03609 [Pelagimonas phthalicica]|uniref:Uncharacterized protein n=1 Tax=Pelagimonas phthalicica TaxID=1037362 RepID=A0A238JGE8_9RHOB|nr:hypothetical protein [Pelagimonas phthalicica]TDS92412.1 hypothetical protein CLV87_3606 [Pelagimonas phthalicica]SMX29473.1 hypothetical protein TRP8649_03609 [Pelagimonas phthalicica]
MKAYRLAKFSVISTFSVLFEISEVDHAEAQGLNAVELSLSQGNDSLQDDEYSFTRYSFAAEMGVLQDLSIQYELERTDTKRFIINTTDVDIKHTVHFIYNISPSSKAGFYLGSIDKDRRGDGRFAGLEYRKDFARTSIELFAESGTNTDFDFDLQSAGAEVFVKLNSNGKIGASYSSSQTKHEKGTFRSNQDSFGLSFEYDFARNLTSFARIQRDIYSESTSRYSARDLETSIEAGIVFTLDRNRGVSFGRRAPSIWQ